MGNPVNWFEIYVNDMERARAFYSAVFLHELTHLTAPGDLEMWNFPMDPEAPNAGGALVKHADGKPGMGGTLVYFKCDDVADELGRVEAAGGKIFRDKMSIGDYGFIGLILDTEGNMVGLHSMK